MVTLEPSIGLKASSSRGFNSPAHVVEVEVEEEEVKEEKEDEEEMKEEKEMKEACVDQTP